MADNNRPSPVQDPSVDGAPPVRVSVLFEHREDARGMRGDEPPFFADLNLDQVVRSITAGREEYELAPFFYSPLRRTGAVTYRQEALVDLQREDVRATVDGFAERMRLMRRHLRLAQELRYRHEQERLFLDGAGIYCDAVESLSDALGSADLDSNAFRRLRDHLLQYRDSAGFRALASDTNDLQRKLAEVSYALHIDGNRVIVDRFGGEPDYTAEVEETFARFRHGAAKEYRFRARDGVGLDHVEAQVLELVARLNPELFARLAEYCKRHAGFPERTITTFDREVQFYLAYVDFSERFRGAGLPFRRPNVFEGEGQSRVEDAFDLALANVLGGDAERIVLNGYELAGAERIIVVTGPNQGGKTTFARMFGTLHHLAALGLPVPARRARLPLADGVFTHFEREEELANLRGKLEDDLIRLREILGDASADSVLVLNESFASTTLHDARFLGAELIERITTLRARAVYVTFVDELASLNEATVSMVAEVDPDDPARRTHSIARRPADGRAYAWALARKHGLTHEALTARVAK